MNSTPPIFNAQLFNTNLFQGIVYITKEQADKLYLTIAAGRNLGLIDNITNGIASANKALVVDSSLNISGIGTLSANRIGFNNVSPAFSIDFGPVAGERLMAIYNNTSSFYGFGASANKTMLHSGSSGGFRFFSGSSSTVSGTQTLDIDNVGNFAMSGNINMNSNNINSVNILTASQISGTLTTAAQTNITSIGTLTSTLNITKVDRQIQISDGVIQLFTYINNAVVANKAFFGTNGLHDLVLTTNNTSRLIISATGVVNISSGLQLGGTTVSASAGELNYLAGVSAGTAIASKALVVDVNKDIISLRNIAYSGILTTSAASTVMNCVVPSSVARSNLVFTGDTGVLWEVGMRGSANTPANALYFYSGAYRMIMMNTGLISIGGNQAPVKQLEVNSTSGACLRLTFNLTSNLVDFSVSSLGVLTIAPSSSITSISGAIASTSNTTGSLILAGGIGISNTTDATSITNGGTFTTAGGGAFAKSVWIGGTTNITGGLTLAGAIVVSNTTDATAITNGGAFTSSGGGAFAKSVWIGGTLTVNKSVSGPLLQTYCGTSAYSVSALLNSDVSIGTGSSNDLNFMVANNNVCNINNMSGNFTLTGSLSSVNLTASSTITATTANISGLTSTGNLNLGSILITATGTELNYCDLTTGAGTAEASKALVLDASRNIVNINSITSNYLTVSLAVNSPNAESTFNRCYLGGIIINSGVLSLKGLTTNPSVYFGVGTNSIICFESSHLTLPIECEINVSNGTKTTSTNALRMGTNTSNDFSLFSNSTVRLTVKASGEVLIPKTLLLGDSTDTGRMLSSLDSSMTAGTVRYWSLGKANSNRDQAEYAYGWNGVNDETNWSSWGFFGSNTLCRLTAWGSLIVNSTQNVYSGIKTKFAVEAAGATENCCAFKNTSASNNKCILFINNSASEIGSIQWGVSTTSYNTSSDYRLKENIKPIVNGLSRVLKLNPVSYDFIGTSEKSEGFLAHELQKYIPYSVCGIKDAMNPDGTADMQCVDYSKLTTILVAAIQELNKKIEILESKSKNILSFQNLDKHIKFRIKEILKDYTVE